jgi:hypothetical protein
VHHLCAGLISTSKTTGSVLEFQKRCAVLSGTKAGSSRVCSPCVGEGVVLLLT